MCFSYLASDHDVNATSSYDKINGSISPYISPISAKLDRIADQCVLLEP